ncbi:MAG: signal peptidase II [Acidobacteriota bacterium]|nr:signal peptidase II [Acidobacteriota bacterium]
MADAPETVPQGDAVLHPGVPVEVPALGWRALLKPSLIATAALIVLADQATKALVAAALPLYESVTIVPGLLDFTHVRNTGAAFGLLNSADMPMKWALMVGMALVAIVAIGAYGATLKPHENVARWGLALVLGGAIGNLIDRARLGYVLDFVDVYSGNWHFWAFNVADAAITVGAILVIFDLLGLRRNASHTV